MGCPVGSFEGRLLGSLVGGFDGRLLGCPDGLDGRPVGWPEGLFVVNTICKINARAINKRKLYISTGTTGT